MTLVEKIAAKFHLVAEDPKNSLPPSHSSGKGWGDAQQCTYVQAECGWASERLSRGLEGS